MKHPRRTEGVTVGSNTALLPEKKAERPRYTPVDLDRHPAVEALLARLGLGAFDRDSLAAPVGRNDAWAGRTTGGRSVFVKRLVGSDPAEVERRMKRLLAFHLWAPDLPAEALRGPDFLGYDRDAALVVFELVDGARNGAELMVDETFDAALATTIGAAVGQLHTAVPAADADWDRSVPYQPPLEALHGLSPATFDSLSFGELQGWRLMQQDADLRGAVTRLREWEAEAPLVPTHCDLRVDQLLITGDTVYLTDWEEFRLADGARDVGSFAGEWLYRSVLDIVTTRGDTVFVDLELTHEMVLSRGVAKMQRLMPLVRDFWRGYRTARPEVDDRFAARAAAFAGWHLLDRLMAGASRASRLSGIERAAAGIGRGVLLQPEKFIDTLGLGDL